MCIKCHWPYDTIFATKAQAFVPWVLFAGFFVQQGLNIPLFVQSLFVNGAAGGFSADVLISIVVF